MDINIAISTAAASYAKMTEGEGKIFEGQKKTRLQFKAHQILPKGSVCPWDVGANDTSELHVYVEKIGEGLYGCMKSLVLSTLKDKFVKSTHEGKTIYININSLSKRIGIPRNQILQAAKKGSDAAKKGSDAAKKGSDAVDTLITTFHEKTLATQQKVDLLFNMIIADKNLCDNGRSIQFSAHTKLPKHGLYTAINEIAFRKLEEVTRGTCKSYELDTGDKKITLDLTSQDGDKLPLITTSKKLGEGANGSVVLLEELSKNRSTAIKAVSVSEKTIHQHMRIYKHLKLNRIELALKKSAKHQIQNEIDLLGKIHKGKQGVIGIQDAPYDDSKDEKLSSTSTLSYRAPAYDGDLTSLLEEKRLSINEIFTFAEQLLEGLVKLQELRIAHGDIKPQNCLVRRTAEAHECVIADFGGAVDLGDSNGVRLPISYSIGYSLDNDRNAFKALKHKDEAEELLYKMDIYSMGVVFEDLLKALAPGDAKNATFQLLVTEMKNSQWYKRPSAKAALQYLKEYKPKA